MESAFYIRIFVMFFYCLYAVIIFFTIFMCRVDVFFVGYPLRKNRRYWDPESGIEKL